jgi:predicted histidine transporter YuiF (NhaC family)
MSSNDLMMYTIGALAGMILGAVNSIIRNYTAVKLIKTNNPKRTVLLVQLFSFLRLGAILVILWATLTFIKRELAYGALAGLLIITIFKTFSYVKQKKVISENNKGKVDGR